MEPDNPKAVDDRAAQRSLTANSKEPALTDPRAVLSLLEADQVVAAKRRTHFGRQRLSARTRFLLWGLRVYVAVMFLIVAISVLRAIHAAH